MNIVVCIGSSCHIKGSYEIVELLKNAVSKNEYQDDITLSGSFCMGKCNRDGVTIQVDDQIIMPVTKENFNEFWNEYIVNSDKLERLG